jgi:hypothetical protein
MRKSQRAPLHHWVGAFHCPECGEPFAYERREDGIPQFQDAYLQVAHVHDDQHPDGLWTASVYRRRKGQRYPEDVKTLQLVVAEQKGRST